MSAGNQLLGAIIYLPLAHLQGSDIAYLQRIWHTGQVILLLLTYLQGTWHIWKGTQVHIR